MKKLCLGLYLMITLMALNSWAIVPLQEGADSELKNLISTLSVSTDWTERAFAALELGVYQGNEKAFQALLDALMDPHYLVVDHVLSALGTHQNSAAYPKIKEMMRWRLRSTLFDYFELKEHVMLHAALDAIGKIGNKEAVSDLFEYFSEISYLSFWGALRFEMAKRKAVESIVMLTPLLTNEEWEKLYGRWKPLLLEMMPVQGLFGGKMTINKFAKETAWIFLGLHRGCPGTSSEILNVMMNQWSPSLRRAYRTEYLTGQEDMNLVLEGTLDDQGKFFGRIGQFKLLDDKGNVICEIRVSKDQISKFYSFWGKKVLVQGRLKHQEGDHEAFFLESIGINSL